MPEKLDLTADILIVSFLARKELAMTLSTLALWTRPGYRITIYNNESKNYPLTWIWNRFFEQSKRDVVVLLNPDVLVAPGWLDVMLEAFANDPSCGAAMPLTNHIPHERIFQVPRPSGEWLERASGMVEHLKSSFKERLYYTEDSRMMAGHCLAIPRTAWQKASGFDENVEFYDNDVYMMERLKRAGFKLAICLHSAVGHMWGCSTREARAAGRFEGPNIFSRPSPGQDFSTA